MTGLLLAKMIPASPSFLLFSQVIAPTYTDILFYFVVFVPVSQQSEAALVFYAQGSTRGCAQGQCVVLRINQDGVLGHKVR